uniref:(northern house mosquito) hypothetical protein n=1 Tax=Culex pipiens TaxID=7175 RepID=A0A8D8BIN6_CULPI
MCQIKSRGNNKIHSAVTSNALREIVPLVHLDQTHPGNGPDPAVLRRTVILPAETLPAIGTTRTGVSPGGQQPQLLPGNHHIQQAAVGRALAISLTSRRSHILARSFVGEIFCAKTFSAALERPADV